MIRALSASEAFYVDFNISVQVVCNISGELAPPVMQAALNHLLKQHPFLGCRILREDGQLHFIDGNEAVPFRALHDGNRDSLIHEELNKALDETQGLIRAVLLQEHSVSTLILTVHHAIIDGLSTVQLVKSLFQTCDEIQRLGSPQSQDIFPIQPSIEALSSQLVTPAELSDFIERYAEQSRTVSLQAIEPQVAGTNSVSNALYHMSFSRDETSQLIQTCKSKQASIHSVIAAAHLMAVRLCIDDSDADLTLRCNTPVDLRQRLQPPLGNKHLLSAATGCGTNHAVNPKSDLWELASEISNDIKISLDNRDVFKSHLTFMDSLMKHRMPTAIGVSSVGLIDIPKNYQHFSCESFSLTGVYRLPMFGVTVCTYDQQLSLTYLYVEPYYSAELIQKIAADVRAYILHATPTGGQFC